MKGKERPWRVAIQVEGVNLPRFAARAGEMGAALTQVRLSGKRMTALVRQGDVQRLREMAEKGGWRFSVGARQGLGRTVARIREHLALLSALVLGIGVLLGASRMMWRVSVENAGVYAADLPAYLQALGISPPMAKRRVNLGELRDLLEWRYPETAWVECGWRGMTLVIRVCDGVPAGQALTEAGAGDVVAARDGIVRSIRTKAGTPLVQVGDFVRKGQTLIRGEERTADGQVRAVSARGVVMARVWDAAAVTMDTTAWTTTYSGSVEEGMTVLSPWFALWHMPDTAFTQADVSRRTMPLGGFFLPLQCVWEKRYECEITKQNRAIEEISAEASIAALRKLREIIGWDESLVDKWVNCSMIEPEVLLAVATGERLVDIAAQSFSGAPAATSTSAPSPQQKKEGHRF